MKFIKIKFSHFMTAGLLILGLVFIQNKATGQSELSKISLKKQQAASKIFGGAKIIEETSWKSYLKMHPDLKEVSDKLGISNGNVYRMNKKEMAVALVVLFTKKSIVFIKNNQNIKPYLTKYFSDSLFGKLDDFLFQHFYIGHDCTVSGDCVRVYHQLDTGCNMCGGTKKNTNLFDLHRVLAQ